MKIHLLSVCLLVVAGGYRQDVLKIKPEGEKLKAVYLSMNVENLWIAEHHVNWETGEPDMPESKHGNKTHCSAFVAATCQKLGIYILRPPDHGQLLLSNAQADWLNDDAAKKQGWQKMDDNDGLYMKAQELANQGKVVVAIYKNSDGTEPGHVALVMPSNRSAERILADGPEVIMAGTHNHNYIALRNGFKSHISNWPATGIQFFVHDVPVQ